MPIARIKSSFDVTLPMRRLYDHTTIRALSNVVDEALVETLAPDELAALLKQAQRGE